MEDEDDSIDSSPTPVRAHSSSRIRHWRKRDSSACLDKPASATGTQLQSEITTQTLQSNDDVSWFDLQQQSLFEADRLDCQRAQQEPVRARIVPASQNFMSLLSMLESQQLPQDEIESSPETPVKVQSPQNNIIHDILQDFCSPPPDEAESNPESSIKLHNSIVQEILKDFCSSPTYDKYEPPIYYVSPQFRFYNKKLRTYGRQSRKSQSTANVATDDDDERMSCSSGLSVQEDFIPQMPTTTHCDFDANSSQRICENLLNLSAFFTQNNVNNSIDLPADRAETEPMVVEELQDATDILKDNGYFICNTEECKLLDDSDDAKAGVAESKEFTLFGERSRLATMETPSINKITKAANLFEECFTQSLALTTETSAKKVPSVDLKPANDDNEHLDGIPFSEWQPMDIPKSTNEVPKLTDNEQLATNVCNQLEEIPLSEWQPIYTPDSVEFRTASNKTIEVSKEKQNEALKLMADLEASYSQKTKASSPEFTVPNVPFKIEFRTASNKTVKLTEEMRKKAAMLMADLDYQQEKGNEQVSAAKNVKADVETNVSNVEAETLDEIPFSEWQPSEKEAIDCSSQLDAIPLSEWQPLDIADPVEFRTASNKRIEVSEQMQKEAAKLIANVELSYSQKLTEEVQAHPAVVQFRTASNKALELTEEMRKRAAMLMADLETTQEPTNECNPSKLVPESVGFRSASNKPIEVSEEMQNAAKNLLADIQEIGSTGKPNECDIVKNTNARKDCLMTATPQTRKPESFSNILFETPKCTPEMQDSLTQLSERSPLDKATKSSIITRRNLLSLNKRRKLKRDSENTDTGHTPIRQRFTPMTTSTSTPVPNRKENIKQEAQSKARGRRCSQETAQKKESRVGKRRSEEALSPIYAPTNKSRRLGLSRIRNKSSNDI